MASVMAHSRVAVRSTARALHTSAPSHASPELATIVLAGFQRRQPLMADTEAAKTAASALEAAMSVVSSASGAMGPSSDAVAAARGDALGAALALSRCGADTSSLPVRKLWDVNSYKNLGSGPLSGFAASELFNGVMVMASSDEKAEDLMAAIATEATGRVDEFPVHALRAMAVALVARDVPAKAFIRAAAEAASRRAHVARLADTIGLLRAAMQAGVAAKELAQEAGTTLAATAEAATGLASLPRAELAEASALVLTAASPAFVATFAPWATALVRRDAASFDAESLDRLVTTLRGAGAADDAATRRALAADAAARARDAAAAAANGFAPEDYGIATTVMRA